MSAPRPLVKVPITVDKELYENWVAAVIECAKAEGFTAVHNDIALGLLAEPAIVEATKDRREWATQARAMARYEALRGRVE